jgi:SAM domain (Sterile alpha motif)
VFSLSVSVQLGVSDYRSAGCTSMHQIADWLEKLGISEYTQRFAENDIDTSVLPHLSDQDLKELGISLGHRRKMLAAIGELAGAAPATPKPVAATETKTQDPAERPSGFLKHNGDRVRSTASETGDGGDASLAIGRRSISDALDRNFLQVADEAIDELRHAVELDSHQAPPLAEGSGWPGAEEVIEEDRQREPVGPRSLPSTPVPEPYCSPPRPRVWIGIVMRFAGAAAVAAVIAALVVWKTSWNMNNGHLDQGPPVASGLSRPVESDDGDRTIIASRRPARAAPKLAVGEESAPSRDTLAGAATSQQREPSPSVQEATPPTAPAAPKLAVGEESAPSRDTLAGAATSQQREPSPSVQEATPPTAPAAPKLAVGEEGAPPRDTLAGAAMSQQREPSARVQEAIPPTAQTMAPGFVTRQLERDEVVLLVKRGEDFITSGDLSSARLVLQRAAEAGDMHAALALAGTFDPNLLAKGFAADVVMSRFWYERAKQFGSTEAPQRLEQLESSVKSAP